VNLASLPCNIVVPFEKNKWTPFLSLPSLLSLSATALQLMSLTALTPTTPVSLERPLLMRSALALDLGDLASLELDATSEPSLPHAKPLDALLLNALLPPPSLDPSSPLSPWLLLSSKFLF